MITCEDFRLHQRKDGRNYIAEFIKDLAVDCDLITRGGGIQDLVRSKQESFSPCLLRDAEVSAKLHSAKTIYLINHEDCGAYGELDLKPGEEEQEQHSKDLKQAMAILEEKFPGVRVRIFLAYLKKGSKDVFEIKEL